VRRENAVERRGLRRVGLSEGVGQALVLGHVELPHTEAGERRQDHDQEREQGQPSRLEGGSQHARQAT
jgi:hypothetical protein